MTKPRYLVVFDVDGTLVDSQDHILAAMSYAFGAQGLICPSKSDVLGFVGLSLPEALARLAPDHPAQTQSLLVEGYKAAFKNMREAGLPVAHAPLYPGALATLHALAAQPETLLGVATGKSRRGLDQLFLAHDLAGMFSTAQVADDHPSKPHPSMLRQCLRDTGVEGHNAVIVGDTEFDMQMGVAAGFRTVGVAWGYHDTARLYAAGAERVIDDFADLMPALHDMMGD